jgi:hypothetical protein
LRIRCAVRFFVKPNLYDLAENMPADDVQSAARWLCGAALYTSNLVLLSAQPDKLYSCADTLSPEQLFHTRKEKSPEAAVSGLLHF